MFMKKIILIVIIAAVAGVGLYALYRRLYFPAGQPIVYGVSFSPRYAQYLGEDPREVFRTILDDWGFRKLRLVAPWDIIEPKPGVFDFSEIDWQMNEAAKRRATVILSVGQKTPRWPECHIPTWAVSLSGHAYELALNDYLTVVTRHFANHPALEIWQIENEPFLPFGGGGCKTFNSGLLKEEIGIVKKTDSGRQTMVSDSGELSTWHTTSQAADLFGTTLYRIVWDKRVGYFSYNFLPTVFYRLKLLASGRSRATTFITELQAEPWIPGRYGFIGAVPLAEQYRSLNIDLLKNNIAYAARIGVPRAYLWGAEWWYWLKMKYGDGSMAAVATGLSH